MRKIAILYVRSVLAAFADVRKSAAVAPPKVVSFIVHRSSSISAITREELRPIFQTRKDNTLASGALPDVITALHADDASACQASCEAARGDAGEGPIATCIEAGQQSAACAGDSTQSGLRSAITLLGQCCRDNPADPLRRIICQGLSQSAAVASQLDFCD